MNLLIVSSRVVEVVEVTLTDGMRTWTATMPVHGTNGMGQEESTREKNIDGSTPQAKPRSHKAGAKRPEMFRDDDGHDWVSQNELARRLRLTAAAMSQWIERHRDKLYGGVHVRDGERGPLYRVDAIRTLRGEVEKEAEKVRLAKRTDDRSRLEKLHEETMKP